MDKGLGRLEGIFVFLVFSALFLIGSYAVARISPGCFTGLRYGSIPAQDL